MAKRRSLSFLERNQRVIGGVALALILAGTAFALLLQGGLLTPTYEVTAMFTDGAGIRPGDNVTVAGLPAGKVDELTIRDGRVAMSLAVEEDVALPADSRAEVVVETLLGRQSVALVPGRAAEPLTDGSVIPVERTTTPIDITELNDISVELMDASDAEAFEQFLGEVTKITAGQAEEVRTLISGLERVTAAVDARRDQLASLLDSIRTLSVTLGQRDDTIVSLIDNLDVVLGNLAERQEDLETLLVSTAGASNETADLVRRNRTVLDATLTDLDTDLQVLGKHQLDLAATVTYLEQSVRGYSSVGYSQNTPNQWANIFVQSLGPAGVDRLVGECGAIDQLFDQAFGADCRDSGEGGGGAEAQASLPGAPPLDPGSLLERQVPEVPALPCSIGDVVDSVLEGTREVPMGAGGCDGP